MTKGNGVLVVVVGADKELMRCFDEDVALIAKHAAGVCQATVQNVLELLQVIEQMQPEVIHLLAKFESTGQIKDASGGALRLNHLMIRAEQMGVHLLVLATETNFAYVKEEIAQCTEMSFMVVTHRNRHFSTFMEALTDGMDKTRSFASAYVALAPQHQPAQRGLPLPGSIAVCPTNNGKGLVLWTEPQK